MPVNYGYVENGFTYLFDDIFVPADAFRQGNLWSWGRNAYWQVGDSTTTDRSTPVTTFAGGTNWKEGFGGFWSSMGIKTDGTLWVWGANDSGQLGNNGYGVVFYGITPVTTFAGGTDWKQGSSGWDHMAAIKTDGTLWTWGNNASGQLGDNTTNNGLTPVTTFAGGTNWKQVSCGGLSIGAIKTDGTLWTWGNNASGQLGDNTTTNRLTPVTTFAGGTNWKQVSCGTNAFMTAVKTDGTLWIWGNNTAGGLGINAPNGRSTPVTTFAGGTNWKQVSASSGFSNGVAAIKTDGTLWVWGDNTFGALGNNNTSGASRSTPLTTFAGGSNWKQVSAGECTLAIKTDGTLWTWGWNGYGQLGINSATQYMYTPVTTFAGGTNWKQVFAGTNMSTATTYIDDYV